MLRLYKANMARFLKNKYFIGGCIIALAATYAVTDNIILFPFLENKDISLRMFFVSAAMVAFFTVYIPVFTNAEYTDGTIRNKLIAGYSQKQVFLSLYLSYASLCLIMWVCYMTGGLIAGADPFGTCLSANIIMLLALMAFIAFMLALSFRITKMVLVVIGAGVIFQTCFSMVMFGNAILMVLSDAGNDTAVFIASVIYNVNALGQWFSHTGFADDITNPGNFLQMIISLGLVMLMYFAGSAGLDKRDVL